MPSIKIFTHLSDNRVNYRDRQRRAMEISDNRFIRRQLNATLDAERKIVCLYAEFCFLNIQIVLDSLYDMDRLEQLADELAQAERRFQLSRAALHRLGVPGSAMRGLDEQERLEIFEVHFRDPRASSGFLKGLFERSDLREMLDDISAPFTPGYTSV
jgi:hypothetical protein